MKLKNALAIDIESVSIFENQQAGLRFLTIDEMANRICENKGKPEGCVNKKRLLSVVMSKAVSNIYIDAETSSVRGYVAENGKYVSRFLMLFPEGCENVIVNLKNTIDEKYKNGEKIDMQNIEVLDFNLSVAITLANPSFQPFFFNRQTMEVG